MSHLDVHYENEPIGGGNPYWRCKSCKRSDPQVSVSGHLKDCEYVKLHSIRSELEDLLTKVKARLSGDYYMPVDLRYGLHTAKDGWALMGVLKKALELFEGVDNHEDVDAARELAEDLINGWARDLWS